MTFTRDQLATYRGSRVDDLVGSRPRLVFVGINPGLWTAATGTHFAHPSNRFYPALHLAGITDREFDRVRGLSDADRTELVGRGIAITNLVAHATARASELSAHELRDGAALLTERIARWRPRVVAIAGVTAYRTAFRRPSARMGLQDVEIAQARVWVVPNPSGLNAHETVTSLADWYRRAAIDAGVVPERLAGEEPGPQ